MITRDFEVLDSSGRLLRRIVGVVFAENDAEAEKGLPRLSDEVSCRQRFLEEAAALEGRAASELALRRAGAHDLTAALVMVAVRGWTNAPEWARKTLETAAAGME